MKKANTISQDSVTLLSFHPRPPNEPPLPDNTAVKLNMVAIKAGAKKPGAKTQKVVPKLRQSRLVLVKKETPPTVDEAIRPVEVTPQPVVSVSRTSPSALSTLPKKIFGAPPRTLRLSTCVCQGGAREARGDRFFGGKIFFLGVVFMVHPNFGNPKSWRKPWGGEKKNMINSLTENPSFFTVPWCDRNPNSPYFCHKGVGFSLDSPNSLFLPHHFLRYTVTSGLLYFISNAIFSKGWGWWVSVVVTWILAS